MALTRPFGQGRNRRVFGPPRKRFSETLKKQESENGARTPEPERERQTQTNEKVTEE
jgi:hypothetical protein